VVEVVDMNGKRNRVAQGALGVLLAGGLLLAACSSGDDASQPVSQAAATEVPAAATQSTQASSSDAVTAKLNLNTATGAEFQAAIPNFPSNMVREFLEYRPYVSIQQFRREIGKYVSAAQVTAWEAYVYVPVDPNDSDAATLMQLPGVTEAVAASLTSARPYADDEAFLTKLAASVAAADLAEARTMLN
jgi:DNA uptake protein ComE-like DNA-binding protein